jgi:hypothetical protein
MDILPTSDKLASRNANVVFRFDASFDTTSFGNPPMPQLPTSQFPPGSPELTSTQMLQEFDARWDYLQKHGSPEEQAAYQEFLIRRVRDAAMQGVIDEDYYFYRCGKLTRSEKIPDSVRLPLRRQIGGAMRALFRLDRNHR